MYAADRSEGLVSLARVATSHSLTAPPLRLPGLDPDTRYRVEHLPLPGAHLGPVRELPAWWADGITLSGAVLGTVGVQVPPLHPETAVLLHLRAAAG